MKKLVLILMMTVSSLTFNAQDIEVGHQQRREPHRHERVCVVPAYTPEEISEITSTLKKLNFDDNRMPVAKLFVKVRPVTVKGLESMAKQFSFDDKKVDFLVFAYDYCVDKENYSRLRNVFTFSSNSDKFLNALGL